MDWYEMLISCIYQLGSIWREVGLSRGWFPLVCHKQRSAEYGLNLLC